MNNFIQRYHKLLALGLLVFWNFLLIAYRVHITGRRVFIFFLWNLFLAILPYLSSEVARYFGSKNKRFSALGFVLFAILFLPNSPYIITDLFHLRERAEMPLWFDTMLVFSVALSGLVLFYVTLFSIRSTLQLLWGKVLAEITVLFVTFLCSFGIYLGRYLRFNSWDVMSNPNNLFDEIANRMINPSRHTQTIGVTLLYGAFLLTGYWVIKLFQMGIDRNVIVDRSVN
jgi:uncharacterized membrane protein